MKQIYDDIWREGAAAIGAGACELDDLIDSPNDTRRGITLVFRPSEPVLDSYTDFLERVRELEPEQYVYGGSEIHTTALSIITCAEDFDLSAIDLASYERVIASCAVEVEPFDIEFRGLTASAGCVMAQGFPVDDTLEQFRSRLREAFRGSALRHTIDARYSIATAHSTLVRFRQPLNESAAFLDLLERHRDTDWGRFRVAAPVLVHNDWYHKAGRVNDLATFPLGV
ncbi:MAG: mutarotase [Pseudomonadota bacterium]